MCRAASFKVEDLCASASDWVVARTAFSPWRGCSLVPGGGEDRYGRGGLSEGRLSCRPARVYGGVGRASLSTLACPRPAAAVPRVGADGGRRFAVGGVAVQVWGGSVIFDCLIVSLSRLCRVWHMPGGPPGHRTAARLQKGHCTCR